MKPLILLRGPNIYNPNFCLILGLWHYNVSCFTYLSQSSHKVDAYLSCEGYEIMAIYSGCQDCCQPVEIPALVAAPPVIQPSLTGSVALIMSPVLPAADAAEPLGQ